VPSTSLAGILTLGKTGLRAGMAHSPLDPKGRERYFFCTFPHIAVTRAPAGEFKDQCRNSVVVLKLLTTSIASK